MSDVGAAQKDKEGGRQADWQSRFVRGVGQACGGWALLLAAWYSFAMRRRGFGNRVRDSGQTDPESGAIGLGNNFKYCS
jgi:hypothetical protein